MGRWGWTALSVDAVHADSMPADVCRGALRGGCGSGISLECVCHSCQTGPAAAFVDCVSQCAHCLQ